jgi:hypothetical protein
MAVADRVFPFMENVKLFPFYRFYAIPGLPKGCGGPLEIKVGGKSFVEIYDTLTSLWKYGKF